MMRVGLAAGLLWALCATASAQTPNPVIQHYRAYEAALDTGDLNAAEREAAAALAASEARDGDGGRTAVLALNLATVRFLNNNVAGALAPGQRALTLAQTHGETITGVAPAFAQLLVARAELAAGHDGAAERLAAAIEAAQQQRLAPAEIYDAALEHAVFAFRNERYGESARSWAIAANFSEGSRLAPAHARGMALTGGAAALVLDEVDGRRRRIEPAVASEAYGMLVEALNVLATLPSVNTDGEVTLAMRSYAEALAWRAVLHAKLASDGRRIPEVQPAQGDGADGLNEVYAGAVSAAAQAPRCHIRVEPRIPSQLYPDEALRQGRLGGVAVFFRINAAGELEDVEALASVGGAAFGDSVERAGAWRVERRADSPPDCRMAMNVIRSISFQLGR